MHSSCVESCQPNLLIIKSILPSIIVDITLQEGLNLKKKRSTLCIREENFEPQQNQVVGQSNYSKASINITLCMVACQNSLFFQYKLLTM